MTRPEAARLDRRSQGGTVVKVDYLFKHGTVMTMDAERRIIEDGGLAVQGNRIVEVGKTAELKAKYQANREIAAAGRILLPGFINIHNHSFNLFTRFMNIPMDGVNPADFGDVLTRWYWPKVEDNNTLEIAYLGALLCASEMLQRGVTTTADMLEGARVIPGGLEEVARGFLEAGLRGVISFEASERVSKEHGELGLAENVRFIEKWNKGPESTITGRLSIHTAFSCSPEYLRLVREWADQLQAGIQLHIAQSPYEVEFIKTRHKRPGPVYLLDEMGLLGPDVLAAHCIYVTDPEIEILARRGVNISYNVKSNQRAANGVAPVPKFMAAGINVGLGVDGINIMDMHELMTHCAYTIRNHYLDRNLIPAQRALEMATINGAKALQLEDQLGSLEAGKKADLIMVDTRGKTHLTPMFNIWEAAAFAARGSDVEFVMVDGRVKVEDYCLQHVEVEKMLAEVEGKAKDFLEKINATPVLPSWRLTTVG